MTRRGFNVPWVIVGMGIAWLSVDLSRGTYLFAALDVALIFCGYMMAKTSKNSRSYSDA